MPEEGTETNPSPIIERCEKCNVYHVVSGIVADVECKNCDGSMSLVQPITETVGIFHCMTGTPDGEGPCGIYLEREIVAV